MQRYAKGLRYAFDEVVKPVLVKAGVVSNFLPSVFEHETNSEVENLWEAFRYASALIRSRSHEGRIPDEPEIVPIVDLLNGLPSHCTEKINVELSSGVTMDGLRTSNIVATKDIAAGQEFIISYGDIRGSACIIKYAYCPKEAIDNPQSSLDVISLRIPSFLGPPDELRAEACRKSDLPDIHLPYDALSTYISSEAFQGEPPDLKAVRQFLMLCHLMDDEAVKNNIATGKLAGSCNPRHVGQLLLLVLDHVMEFSSLNKSTNEEDLEKASTATRSDMVAAHHVRVCQRDTLARWRNAISRRYGLSSEHVEPKAIYSQFILDLQGEFCPDLPIPRAPPCLVASRGCHVCGRTINLKACSKCKVIKYCGREHQIIDWKTRGHRRACDPLLAEDE